METGPQAAAHVARRSPRRPRSGPVSMRLKAMFTIELEATDFVEAAGHQRVLEEKLAALRETFPGSQLKIVNARSRLREVKGRRTLNRNVTGRLSAYAD